jgi:hypothetical protein
MHVIVEKPWQCSRPDTNRVSAVAQQKELQVGCDFEYCLLDAVERWRAAFHPGTGVSFGGWFSVDRANRLDISAMENLGCHLAAIREYAVPEANILELHAAYEAPNRRTVWLKQEDLELASLDFQHSGEPILQRFVRQFEGAITACRQFPFDLSFASKVQASLTRYVERRQGNAPERELGGRA